MSHSTITGYSTPEAADAVGVSYRMADYWARTGLVVPSREAHGSGTQRRYTFDDVMRLAIVKRLLDNGMSLQSIRRAVRHLPLLFGDHVETLALVVTSTDVFVCTHDAVAALLVGSAAVFTVLPFGGLAGEIREHLDQYDAIRAARRAGADPALGV